ncbi:MAG: di-trans,poly-cis-decaprenylcistransferase [Candidatus Eremiobacteraeota bacterium]|nr:di-trans,poly-cis-decaprenylcistransferase [Candidatus Eremiobacteraeota bacterium]
MALSIPALSCSPRHVAIIMDGNRRWARERGEDLSEGYRRGVTALRAAVRAAVTHKLEVLTVYGFSTENWRRETSEISLLMQICAGAAQSEVFGLVREAVRVRIVGDISPFPPATRAALAQLVRATARNSKLTLQLALNYSGRAEILAAIQSIARDVESGTLLPETIDEDLVRGRLYEPQCPDPDLLIRTGGDLRISNFLLYQLAYTELFTTDVLWPDFSEEHFSCAVAEYARRHRRYGE